MKINSFLILLALLSLCAVNGQSQGSGIRLRTTSTGVVESIVFRDSVSGKENTFAVFENNPYKNLGFKSNSTARTRGADVNYDLTGQDTRQLVSRFFPSKKTAFKNINSINFKSASVSTYAEPLGDYAVIIYYLRFRDDMSTIAKKSTAIVVDSQGKVISSLPESDNGYYSHALTKNGKYIAFYIGDVSPEASFTLFDGPKFEIYEVKSGMKVFEIPNGPYSFMSPVAFDNLIRIVLQKSNGMYEYNIISMEDRVQYKKEYTRDEIENLLRFQINGMVFKGRDGQERLDEFSADFVKVKF